MEVVDAHGHFGHLADMLPDYESHEPMPDRAKWEELEFKARTQSMQNLDIDWVVMQPSHSYLKADGIKDTMKVNDGMAAYRRRDPRRFPKVLGTVEPLHGERNVEEIDRVKHELKLDGLSWHPRFSGVFLDNKWMRLILRRMSDLKLVPFVHTNPESKLEAAWQLKNLAREFPDLTFVTLDAFISYEGTLESLRIAEDIPNSLWIAGPIFSWPIVENWVRRHGSTQIAYGGGTGYSTIYPAKSHRLLEEIRGSRLSDADKANILAGNIRRVFGMPPK